MPVVMTSPQFPNQVGSNPSNQSFSTELNFGQMLREVTGWNPNLDPMTAGRFVNQRYRDIIDRRAWYGTKVRGNISLPNVTNTGTCTCTANSNLVQGVGTNWTPLIVGQQFRQSFTQPYQTITYVNPGNQTLLLDTPFPGPTNTGGYQVASAYVTFGANIKRLSWCINQLNGWPLVINVPVERINALDPWRQSLGWATALATRAPTPDGQFQVEVWPTPYANQVLPFEAFSQPPEMILDSDSPVAWIRADAIVSGATADALRYRPKANSFYSEAIAVSEAAKKDAEFERKITAMEFSDDDLYQQSVTWDYDDGVIYSGTFAQTHDI